LFDALGPVDAMEAQVFNGVDHPPLRIPAAADASDDNPAWYADGYAWLLALGAAILLGGVLCGGCYYVVLRRRHSALVLALSELPLESPGKEALALAPYAERTGGMLTIEEGRQGALMLLTDGREPPRSAASRRG
jgi:hypothetical protein